MTTDNYARVQHQPDTWPEDADSRCAPGFVPNRTAVAVGADNYAALREALKAGPTPGPWVQHALMVTEATWNQGRRDSWIAHCGVGMRFDSRCGESEDNASYIAAANPETISALLAERDALAASLAAELYVICHECSGCGHAGINDSSGTDAACNHCGWSGPSPTEDKCPECGQIGTMVSACPKCGDRYTPVADARLTIEG